MWSRLHIIYVNTTDFFNRINGLLSALFLIVPALILAVTWFLFGGGDAEKEPQFDTWAYYAVSIENFTIGADCDREFNEVTEVAPEEPVQCRISASNGTEGLLLLLRNSDFQLFSDLRVGDRLEALDDKNLYRGAGMTEGSAGIMRQGDCARIVGFDEIGDERISTRTPRQPQNEELPISGGYVLLVDTPC